MLVEIRCLLNAHWCSTKCGTSGCNMLCAVESVGVYQCCGRPAQRGPSQRPLPQSGCAYQPHTPVTPPEAPTYHLDPASPLSGTRLADTAADDSAVKGPSLVHILLKHQELIVRPSGDARLEDADAARMQEAEEDRAQVNSEHQVTCADLSRNATMMWRTL